jgi:hypothetical protein
MVNDGPIRTRVLGFHGVLALLLLMSGATPGRAADWTPLTNLAPNFPGTMILLSDGTVMVQNYSNPAYQGWMRLTPDSKGSYINGTWSLLAPMSTPRLYFASQVLTNGNVWVLGGEYSGSPLKASWTPTGEMYDTVSNTWSPIAPYPPEDGCPLGPACFGDDPSMLLQRGMILAGDLVNRTPHLYDIATNTWLAAGLKIYSDSSDEETWVKLPNGEVLTYDLFHSVQTGGQYAEKYNPVTNTWSSISPSDGTAQGFIPQLSSASVGFELGPAFRLQDGRIFLIGATGHTAFYTPSVNRWTAGPDIVGTLSNLPARFGADDAPGAEMPNGHVLFTADAGPSSFTSSGDTTAGSKVITAIPSTAILQVGWAVRGVGVPAGSSITSVDSPSQIHISNAVTATLTGEALTFGGTFSIPTQIFEFDPVANTISPVTPSLADPSLAFKPSFVTRMLVLPTGQILFNDDSRQLYVYTPDGGPKDDLRPVIHDVVYDGGGVFTLAGTQLNGQSAGSTYGDDVESDENFPIVRLSDKDGAVFYARTTNWTSTGVATGRARERVDFTLPAGMPPGKYRLVDIGAGIASLPVVIRITPNGCHEHCLLGDGKDERDDDHGKGDDTWWRHVRWLFER